MPSFPSVEWFNALKEIVNKDPDFRALGTVDSVLGVKVGNKIIEITFDAFECTNVRDAGENDLRLPEGFARAHDGYRRDAFYRFNQSIQDFFNASSKIDTQFLTEAAVA